MCILILLHVNAGILKVNIACQDCFVIKVQRLPTVFLDACHLFVYMQTVGTDTRFEFHSAVLLKIQILWVVILCQGE